MRSAREIYEMVLRLSERECGVLLVLLEALSWRKSPADGHLRPPLWWYAHAEGVPVGTANALVELARGGTLVSMLAPDGGQGRNGDPDELLRLLLFHRMEKDAQALKR